MPWTGCETAEELVAYAARVSNPTNQNNKETAPRLLKYLMKHKHWSPFEMINLTMEITTTRDISRQILRHRSFAFQEFSQRYAEAMQFSLRNARLQDEKNRQNSIEVTDLLSLEEATELVTTWIEHQESVTNRAREAYTWALENGIAKEQARVVLPEGNTDTTMYMQGSLRSWIHYCELRMGIETQKEHRQVAKKCWAAIAEHIPSIWGLIES
jgi:thymidylate synthase (FAD)